MLTKPTARVSRSSASGRAGGRPRAATLAFRERTAPTLIRGLAGESVFSSGEITLDPATGRITSTRMTMKIGSIRVDLSTRYAHEPRLEMTVPVSFSEHYLDGTPPRDGTRRSSARHEEILCEARYSDFRLRRATRTNEA